VTTVRYGILGTARVAGYGHVPAARASSNAEIVAVSSRDLARAQAFARQHGIPRAYGSYAELLEDPDIDAVINPLVLSLHCEWTVRAAETGKHVLCEKPFAATVDEAQRMIDAAEANGVLLMQALNPRLLPCHRFVLDTIDSGAIGEVRAVRSEMFFCVRDWDTDMNAKTELSGGVLLEAGCYCVDVIRGVLREEPISVQAFERIKEDYDVQSAVAGIMRVPGDRLAFFCTGNEEAPLHPTYEVIGTEGRIEVPDMFSGTEVRIWSNQFEPRVVEFESASRFQVQIEHFTECILNGQPVMFPPEDAKRNTAALVALLRAARLGRAVEV